MCALQPILGREWHYPLGRLIMSMEDWNDFKKAIREARVDQRPKTEPTPFKSPYQKKTKAMRRRNDIYSTKAGHKNLSTGAPFNNKTQQAGTDRLRFEDVDPSSIELDSFQIQDDLERRLWNDEDELKPLIRQHLMKIAMDFIENLELAVKVKDIKLTGSIANYNWSKYSDIDLHIVVDFSDYADNEDLVRGYFDGKRIAWNQSHDIKVLGYDVEMYVEGDDDVHISTGMYSILRDEWIIRPERKAEKFDGDLVKQKAAYLMDMVDAAKMVLDRDDHKAAYAMAGKLKERISRMRKCGLEKGGAYSVENLAFKVLRRNGYLGKLSDIKNDAYDNMHTVKTTGKGIKVKI